MTQLRHPWSAATERIITQAHREVLTIADRQVVCHGDLNPGNLLSAQRLPWLAVDPLAVIADPAYDCRVAGLVQARLAARPA